MDVLEPVSYTHLRAHETRHDNKIFYRKGYSIKVLIKNIETIVSGDYSNPLIPGDSILLKDGVIYGIGNSNFKNTENCDVIIDADGATITPGFIDSHVHITFGDYTPRQNTIGYLSSYLHGGTTTSITASEVHVPGRPNDPEGVKALAVAAKKCFDNYKPGGTVSYTHLTLPTKA